MPFMLSIKENIKHGLRQSQQKITAMQMTLLHSGGHGQTTL
jgi:hypothetical protein